MKRGKRKRKEKVTTNLADLDGIDIDYLRKNLHEMESDMDDWSEGSETLVQDNLDQEY